MEKFPCINCLTFPICKTKFKQVCTFDLTYKGEIWPVLSYFKPIVYFWIHKERCKCELLTNYLIYLKNHLHVGWRVEMSSPEITKIDVTQIKLFEPGTFSEFIKQFEHILEYYGENTM